MKKAILDLLETPIQSAIIVLCIVVAIFRNVEGDNHGAIDLCILGYCMMINRNLLKAKKQ